MSWWVKVNTAVGTVPGTPGRPSPNRHLHSRTTVAWPSPTPVPGVAECEPCSPFPLAPGTSDEPWLAAVARAVEWTARAGCTAVVVSLGVDAAVEDPESPLAVAAYLAGAET